MGAVKELTGRARRTASSARAKARGGGKGKGATGQRHCRATPAVHHTRETMGWQIGNGNGAACFTLHARGSGSGPVRCSLTCGCPTFISFAINAIRPRLSASALLLSLSLSLPLQAAAAAADSRFSSLSGRAFTHHAGRVGMAEIRINECKELCSHAKPSLAYDFSHGACTIV